MQSAWNLSAENLHSRNRLLTSLTVFILSAHHKCNYVASATAETSKWAEDKGEPLKEVFKIQFNRIQLVSLSFEGKTYFNIYIRLSFFLIQCQRNLRLMKTCKSVAIEKTLQWNFMCLFTPKWCCTCGASWIPRSILKSLCSYKLWKCYNRFQITIWFHALAKICF